jgi:hypothetical protein
LQHGLQALLELAAILRARQRAHPCPGHDALVLQPFGDIASDDPLRQPLDDCRLADAGLTDEHGVVLRAPREHLDYPPDLLVASDHRVEAPAPGQVGQVAPIPLERLVLALGVLIGNALRAPNGHQRREDGVSRYSVLLSIDDRL